MFEKVIISILVLILAILVYFVIDFLRTVTSSLKRILHDIEVITQAIRKEQEFVSNIMSKGSNAMFSLEETLAGIESIIQIGKNVRTFFKKQPNTNQEDPMNEDA